MAAAAPPRILEIDITPFLNNGSTDDEKNLVVRQVKDACEQIGFFIITGHGISIETVEEVYSMAQQVFDLSLEKKNLLRGSGCGYLPMEAENLAITRDSNAPSDLKESFNIGSSDKKNHWPDLPQFKTICREYFNKMVDLASVIMQIFARALELPGNYFDDYIVPINVVLRFVNYPQLTSVPLPQQLRCAEHTDYGTLTIVRPNSPGLEAKDSSGNWIAISAPPNSFVVNIGDIMRQWTNDKWQSTLHRVTNPPQGDDSCRQSIVFFHNPRDDGDISCLPTCCNEEYPKRHETVKAGVLRKIKSQKSRNYAQL